MHTYEKTFHFWYNAPDGIYVVWINRICEPEENYGIVNFPLCEHSAGQLHGDFKYDLKIELIQYTLYEVWIKDNIIVYAYILV